MTTRAHGGRVVILRPPAGPDLRASILTTEEHGITRRNEPVTLGIPIPRGTLTDLSQLSLRDPANQPVPLQSIGLNRWSDGSVKWVLLDFPVHLDARDTAAYELRFNAPSTVRDAPRLSLRGGANEFVVDTGPAEFRIDTRRFRPFHSVALDGRPLLEPAATACQLTDAKGTDYEALVEATAIEISGPLRATVRLRGVFANRLTPMFCQFFASLSFFAASPVARVTLTIRNPRRARHRGNCWDLGDSGSIYLRDLSLVFASGSATPARALWSIAPQAPFVQGDERLEIYQDSSGGANWRSENHINRHRRIPVNFCGYRIYADDKTWEGERAHPLVAMLSDAGGLAAAVDGFWQNFPKAIEVDSQRLIVRLFPRQWSDVHELQAGEQKTHTVYVAPCGGPASVHDLEWVRAPLVLHAAPAWYADSQAIPYLTPRALDPNEDYLGLIDAAVTEGTSFNDKRELIDEYGWRNFGELYADHEQATYRGNGRVVSHYNNQYDAIHGLAVQFLRTGDARWFQLMQELARHVVDIDIYHTKADRPAFNNGLFWHTDHGMTAATATHRTYSRHNRSRGGGPSNEHCYTTGLLYHYFLTGDSLSREAVIDLARWVIDMDDGRQTALAMLSARDTGLASRTAEGSYHGPGRGAGNAISACLDAFTVTADVEFLDKAEQLIRRCIHPQDDIDGRGLLDAERRWSYVVFLQVLGRYLDGKLERREIDPMYVYAKESLLAYARWMAEREGPNLDRREALLAPTETWAAMDMRKSEVFKFAAKYGPEDWSAVFLERSRFFFRTAVDGLASSSTRTLTRPVVVLMSNGYMDAYFQQHEPEPVPAMTVVPEFDRPSVFVPQRRHAAGRLGLLAGLVGATFVALWPGIRRVGGKGSGHE
jgi:hypothetical protein